MNGFERHGIDHSSASAINTWVTSPSGFIAQYLFGHKGRSSPAMWRGVAAEDCVRDVIARGQSFNDALSNALGMFDRNTVFSGDPGARQKERDAIKPMAELAIDALVPYGKPDFPEDGSQHQISINVAGDGWNLLSIRIQS